MSSERLRISTELIFTYDTQSGNEIVQPLPNVTVANGTNATQVTVTAVHAGKVIIGLYKNSEFSK